MVSSNFSFGGKITSQIILCAYWVAVAQLQLDLSAVHVHHRLFQLRLFFLQILVEFLRALHQRIHVLVDFLQQRVFQLSHLHQQLATLRKSPKILLVSTA